MSSDEAEAEAGAYARPFERPIAVRERVAGVGRLERALWIAVGLALVGDVATTFVGLRLGLAEANPIARGVIVSYGLPGMVVLKAAAVGIAGLCRLGIPRTYGPLVPACLATPWVVAVGINLYMISTVL